MVGGNPLGDRFGFRYWNNPGAFATLYYDGNLGYFLGFLQCLIQASFTIAGPDYVSMAVSYLLSFTVRLLSLTTFTGRRSRKPPRRNAQSLQSCLLPSNNLLHARFACRGHPSSLQ